MDAVRKGMIRWGQTGITYLSEANTVKVTTLTLNNKSFKTSSKTTTVVNTFGTLGVFRFKSEVNPYPPRPPPPRQVQG